MWESSVLSLRGKKNILYHLLMIIRRHWVYPNKRKLDVLAIFKELNARVELEIGKKYVLEDR